MVKDGKINVDCKRHLSRGTGICVHFNWEIGIWVHDELNSLIFQSASDGKRYKPIASHLWETLLP